MEHAEESEQAVLGCLLIEPDQFITARKFLSVDDFYSEKNQNIWKAFEYFQTNGIIGDIVTIAERFAQVEVKIDYTYLDNLTNSACNVWRLKSYCWQVKQASMKRQVKNIHTQCLDDLKDDKDTSAEDIIINTMAKLLNIRTSEKNVFTMNDAIEMLENRLKDKDKNLLSTGFHALDNVIPGVPRHSLCTLAAESFTGKTVFMCNAAIGKAKRGEKVLIITLEVPVIDIMEILVPQLSDDQLSASYQEMYSDRLEDEDIERILQLSTERLKALNIFFAEDVYTIEEITATIDYHKKNFDIDSVYIDNIQFIDNVADYKEYVRITKELKKYSLKNKINVWALSQLNDNKEKRQDKEPRANDLRGGRNLHQDSDIVIFLYKLEAHSHQVYLKVDKNRKGASSAYAYAKVLFDSDHRKIGLSALEAKPELESEPKRRQGAYHPPQDDDNY